MLNPILCDPAVVQSVLDDLEPIDPRTLRIMGLYESLHATISIYIEELVVVAKVRRWRQAMVGGTPLQCPNPPKRCWVCNTCAGLVTQSAAKVRVKLEELQDQLVEVLLEVEADAESLRKRMGL